MSEDREPLSSVVVIDEERDEVRVRGARITGDFLRNGIKPTAEGFWFRIESVTDVITVRQKDGRIDDDRTLLLRAMLAGVARWKPATSEICCGGLCYSTRPDEEGTPRLTDAVRAALVDALAPSTINPTEIS